MQAAISIMLQDNPEGHKFFKSTQQLHYFTKTIWLSDQEEEMEQNHELWKEHLNYYKYFDSVSEVSDDNKSGSRPNKFPPGLELKD